MRILHLRTAWAQARYAPGRLASAAAATALGVALASSILLVGEEIPHAIEESVQAVVGRADLQVVARSPAGMTEDALARIATVPGVAVAAPVLSIPTFFDDEAAEQVTVWGIDLLNESALSLYGMQAGLGVEVDDPLVFASQTDSVIAPADLLERRGLNKGDSLRVVTPAGIRTLTVRGVLKRSDRAPPSAGAVLITDVYSAQIAFAQVGRFSHVDVLLTDGSDPAGVQALLDAQVGEAAHVGPTGTRQATARSMLAGAQLLIRAMSLCGIVLAVLVTFNRLSTVFYARQWEVGVSRALGASPLLAILELLKEAFLVGIAGALLGSLAAGVLSRGIAPMLAQVAEVTTASPVPQLDVQLRLAPLVSGALLGITAALLGALLPARRATSAAIVAALHGRGLEEIPESHRIPSGLPALLLALVGGALLWLELRVQGTVAGLLALPVLVLAACMLARPALALLLPALGRLASRLAGPVGRIAARDLSLSMRRAAGSVRMVAVGLGTVLWFHLIVASFEFSLAKSMGGSRRADLIVASAHDVGGDMAPLAGEILDQLAGIPGVLAVSGERASFGEEFGATAFGAPHFLDPRFFAWSLEGPSARDALERVAAGRGILVTPGFAAHRGVSVGDEVALASPTGTAHLTVAGIDTTSVYSNKGDITIGLDAYRRLWNDTSVTRAHVVLAPGESAATVRNRILRALGPDHRLRIFTADELAAHYEHMIRRAGVLLQPMSFLVLVVVVLGIVDGLLATVLERTRELGTMRAIGAAPKVVGIFVLVQAVILSLVGVALATPIALLLGFAFLRVTSLSLLGWRQDLVLDPVSGIALLALGTLAALVGAIFPTWRATRLPPAEALRSE